MNRDFTRMIYHPSAEGSTNLISILWVSRVQLEQFVAGCLIEARGPEVSIDCIFY